MRHRLFTLAAAVSLILFLVCAGLWLRGLWRTDVLWVKAVSRSYGITAGTHVVYFRWTDRPRLGTYYGSEGGDPVVNPNPYQDFFRLRWWWWVHNGECRLFGFAYEVETSSPWEPPDPVRFTNIAIPLYFPTAISPIVPLLWLRKVLRHRRRQRLGLCLRCGYDLRASQDRCPECGTPFPPAAETGPSTSGPSA